MIAVIDAGGTKTEMYLGNSAKREVRKVEGINPYFQSDEEIRSRLQHLLLPTDNLDEELKQVWYYGTGCSNLAQSQRVHVQLTHVFRGAKVVVEHDLMGACRALCFDAPGLVGILGTGSNACAFNGQQIEKQMVSLGFWLGDEGGGGNLGKMLLSDWLKGRFPADLEPGFANWVGIARHEALARIYADKNANTTVARLAAFAVQNRNHSYLQEKIRQNFRAYFYEIESLTDSYEKHPFHFTGSIAFQLQDVLKELAWNLSFETGKIVSSPTEELFTYHTTVYAAT